MKCLIALSGIERRYFSNIQSMNESHNPASRAFLNSTRKKGDRLIGVGGWVVFWVGRGSWVVCRVSEIFHVYTSLYIYFYAARNSGFVRNLLLACTLSEVRLK